MPGVMRVNIEKTQYYVYYRRNKSDDVVILTVWSPVMGSEPTFRKGGEDRLFCTWPPELQAAALA